MQPSLTIEAPALSLRASVTFDRWDGDRPQYAWRIEAGEESAEGSDLRLGAFDRAGQDAEALATLLHFLGAYCDGRAYARRNGLDPADVDSATLFHGLETYDADGDSLTLLAWTIWNDGSAES